MVGVNLRIVPGNAGNAGTRAGQKATVTKRDVIVPSLSEEERAAVAAEGGGLGLLGPTRRVCLVCKARASAYSCPRCSTPYCSAACYKGHNAGCTEGFYRRHVEGEMQLRDAEAQEDGAGKRATIEALRRVRLEGEGTGDDWLAAAVGGGDGGSEAEGLLGEERLAELAALAERGELDLGMLTPEEERAFLRAVASGEVGQGLEVWRAWWEGPPALSEATGAPLVMDEEGEEEEPEGRPIDLPSIWRALERWRRTNKPAKQPAAAAAAAAQPSPLLRYHLLDVLFAYAAVTRTYNGQWAADPPQAAQDLLALSSVLEAAASTAAGSSKEPPAKAAAAPLLPSSAAGALASSLAALRRWDAAPTPQSEGASQQDASPALAMGLALARDVSTLLSHATLVACALLDASRLLRVAVGELLVGGGLQAEADGDLAALAAQLERALGGGGGAKEEETKQEREARRHRRSECRRLLRALHKLRFLLAWAESQGQQGQASWLLPLRAEVLVALREHEAVVARGGGGQVQCG